MTLKDWLESEGVTVPQFALRIGRTAESVRRYVAGERIPDKETMPLIATATGQRVLPNDFFDLQPQPRDCCLCDRAYSDPAAKVCRHINCPVADALTDAELHARGILHAPAEITA